MWGGGWGSRVSSPVGWLVGGLAHYDALPTSRPPLLKERRHRKRKRILSEGGTLACPLLWAQGNRSDILWPPPLWPSSSKIGAMSFDAVTLFKEVMDPGTAETLASICRPQGLCRAIDIAMVDDSMATELLQGLDGELREPLTKAVALARPLVRGWATSFRLKEGGVVGGGSGGVFCGFPAPPPVRPLFRRSPCTFFCAGYPLGTVRCTGRGAYFGSALLPAALGFHQEDS